MAGVGGYQPPANPAPVSGPGALSQRTDGGPGQAPASLPDAQYGEQAEFQELQAGAPMAVDRSGVTPLDAPTGRPAEPVSAGSPLGEGPGPEILPSAQDESMSLARAMDFLPALLVLASQPNVDPQTRQLVRQLQSRARGSGVL